MAGLANDTAVQPRRRQRRARVAERLASALARRASRGRPGGVIARPQGRLPVRFPGDQLYKRDWLVEVVPIGSGRQVHRASPRLHQGGFGMGWRCCCEGL